VTPAFRTIMKDAEAGLVLKPLLHAYLYDARFPETFTVEFRRKDRVRTPDGWFHPSSHPMWPERLLYLYLTEPDKIEAEAMEYMGSMSVTIGTAMHSFIQMCLRDQGVLLTVEQMDAEGIPHDDEGEPYLEDPLCGSRGHTDGILNLHLPKFPLLTRQVFEFKCLAPETIVNTPGGPVRAEDLLVGDEVWAWGSRLERGRVKAMVDNGIRPVWTITTKAGRDVKVTEEHPFLTSHGWVKTKDLRPLDCLRVATGDERPDRLDDIAWFIGLMVGDGCLVGHHVGLSNRDADILAQAERIAVALGARMVPSGADWRFSSERGPSLNPVKELMRGAGLQDKNSRTKAIPAMIWEGGPNAWVGFLSGYFDADGCAQPPVSASWSSVNHPLLVDCQTMLALLGVRSSIVEVHQWYRDCDHLSWRLVVRDRLACKRLADLLTVTSRSKAERLGEFSRLGAISRCRPSGDVEWDVVVSVTEGLARPTVGVEVDGWHTHVTEGLVTHNTSNLSKLQKLEDLDLEAFIELWPAYYAQQQEYMRMSGYGVSVVIFLAMGYPWTIKEFHVPADPKFQNQIKEKYLRVRQSVVHGDLPMPCCGARSATSRSCPARFVCPVGLM